MIQKLTRQGERLAILLDDGVASSLNIQEGTLVDVTSNGSVVIVKPVDASAHKAALADALEDINARYGRALKNLAE